MTTSSKTTTPAAATATPATTAPAVAAVPEKTAAPQATAPTRAKAAKSATKSAAKPVAKPAEKASTTPAAKVPAKAKPAVAAKPAKAKKPKLVRDSFTIPKAEYTVLDDLKLRTITLAQPAKKSELLRAGIKALAAMSDAALRDALLAVPTIKTGRPAAAPKKAAKKA